MHSQSLLDSVQHLHTLVSFPPPPLKAKASILLHKLHVVYSCMYQLGLFLDSLPQEAAGHGSCSSKHLPLLHLATRLSV